MMMTFSLLLKVMGGFKSIPSFASEEALYVLLEMLRGMGAFLWFDLFGRFHYSAVKNKPRIATPGIGIAG